MGGRALLVVGAGRALLAKDGRLLLVAMGSNGALLAATDIKLHSTSNVQRIKSRTHHPHKSHTHLYRAGASDCSPSIAVGGPASLAAVGCASLAVKGRALLGRLRR
eukprot:3259398-Pleurochrysis_carterae.AAC.1